MPLLILLAACQRAPATIGATAVAVLGYFTFHDGLLTVPWVLCCAVLGGSPNCPDGR
jgi:hypothetical protein